LVSDENLKQAISRAKTMQTEWKAIGPAPFRDEREYWQQFRAACDALFARLEKEAPKAEAGRDNRNAGRKPAERSNKTGASASPPAQRTSRRQQALITEVSARASYCQELESALLEGKPLPGENEELTAQWEALPAVSDSVLASQLQQRFDRVCALRADSSALLSAAEDNAEPARKLCVDLEIQAGLPSPDEDRALRMQQQLAQLKQDFGQASLSASQRSEALHRLKLEFFCLGPLTPALRGRLQPRVEKIR
jgi:exonuclease SbcC